ncbi:MAG: hypothetical protein SF162_13985 [bacterium]|nr:hypothetical protein [bacterium]
MMLRPFGRLLRRFSALWNLHPPVGIVVAAPQSVCLQTLITAARPSQQRLHLRDVFAEGRRYYIQPRDDGFRMASNTSTRRNGQRIRSRVAAFVIGTFSGDESITLVRLRYRAAPYYALVALFVPAFASSIIFYMEWPVGVRAVLIAVLFGLSWVTTRLEAALQVGEMVFFVQKALEDLPPVSVPELAASHPDVVLNNRQDFTREWEKFYRQVQKE